MASVELLFTSLQFLMIKTMASNCRILPITLDEESRVISFLNTNFMKDEPLNASQPESLREQIQAPLEYLKSGLCLKMVSGAGDLLGVAINAVDEELESVELRLDDLDQGNDGKEPGVNPIIEQFIRHITEMLPANIKDAKGIMRIHKLAVRPESRNKGIGRRLIEASVQLAQERHLPGIQANCSNHYSSQIFSAIDGFTRILSVPFASFVDPDCGKPFFSPPPPHVSMDVFYMTPH